MKAINLLLKICKKDLDKLLLQKKLLSTELDMVISDLEMQKNEIRAEVAKYANTEYAIFLENYQKGAKLKIRSMEVRIQNIENKLASLDSEIMEKFGEIKRYEIIMQNQKKAKLIKEHKAETKHLDELTIIKVASNRNAEDA